MEELGIEVLTEAFVKDIEKENKFTITLNNGEKKYMETKL